MEQDWHNGAVSLRLTEGESQRRCFTNKAIAISLVEFHCVAVMAGTVLSRQCILLGCLLVLSFATIVYFVAFDQVNLGYTLKAALPQTVRKTLQHIGNITEG